MGQQEILDKVKAILEPYVKNKAALAQLKQETSILEDLQVNSARLVDIILAFEDEFDIQIDDESADQVGTIGDAVDLIRKKLGED